MRFFSRDMAATEAVMASATSSSLAALNNNNNNSSNSSTNNNNNTSNGGSNKMLPSFSDILWCPDIDGDVMSDTNIGGAMVKIY